MSKRRQQVTNLSGVAVIRRESTRTWIAYIAIGGFLVLVLVILLGGWVLRGLPTTEVLQVISTVSGVFGGLVGAAIGFYFRSEVQS
ncbi:MAG TPA: hypothetical protein VJ793_01865 [Anaerolineae bacterium]|nr:hypothetical protein [Pyrinomonadaceae bacterium]HKZ82384.1 hypothetical protein [Anaerolineae bacterium]